MKNHDEDREQFAEEYNLSLDEAAAFMSWDAGTITRWAVEGQEGYGLLPALRTPDGLRFRTSDIVAYIAPEVDWTVTQLTEDRIEWIGHMFATMARLSGRPAGRRKGNREAGEVQRDEAHAGPQGRDEGVESADEIEATRALARAYRDAALGHKEIANALGDAVRAATRIGELLGETDNTGIHILIASELDRQAWHHAETTVSLSHAAETLMQNAQLRSAVRMLSED